MWLILSNLRLFENWTSFLLFSPDFLAHIFVLTAGHDMDLPVQHIAIGDAVGGMTIIKVLKYLTFLSSMLSVGRCAKVCFCSI